MSSRPLRQLYGHDRTLTLEGTGPPLAPFARHRARFLAALAALTEDEWSATTRCEAWSAKDVANHLVTADGFWVLTLQGRHAPEPTTHLRGFDPTTSPDSFIAATREDPPAAAHEALTASTDALTAALAGVAEDEWSLVSESPVGHVPVRAIAVHSLWDSWLHERDVLLPLGRTPAVEDDELLPVTAFSLFFGGLQGGLLDDDEPVGPGPDAPIEAVLAFDDLPGRAVEVAVDRGVRVAVVPPGEGTTAAGSAVALVEAMAGRAPVEPVLDRLPEDLGAQLDRARRIL